LQEFHCRLRFPGFPNDGLRSNLSPPIFLCPFFLVLFFFFLNVRRKFFGPLVFPPYTTAPCLSSLAAHFPCFRYTFIRAVSLLRILFFLAVHLVPAWSLLSLLSFCYSGPPLCFLLCPFFFSRLVLSLDDYFSGENSPGFYPPI